MFSNIITIIFSFIAFGTLGIFTYFLSEHLAPSPEESVALVEEQLPLVATTTSALAVPRASTSTKESSPRPFLGKDGAPSPKQSVPAATNGTLIVTATTTETVVVAPGPLRAVSSAETVSSQTLTREGVFRYTNSARVQNGMPVSFVHNETLDRIAQAKLDDMFSQQYFEHVSPIGVGPADLAKAIGYAYVIVGENLALGNFASDEKLVDAWMNSPGHRANILNEHYQEIGIAVGKGMFEGRETWLAVQSFGMPLSACPAADTTIKAQIESNNVQIAEMRSELDSKKAQIETTSPYDSSYNMYVSEYNTLVPSYNMLVESTRTLVVTYNAGVHAFNDCISSVSTPSES